MRWSSSSFVLCSLLLTGCGASSRVVGRTSRGAEIVQIELSHSNAYLIKSTPRPILVDAGSESDEAGLRAELARSGTRFEDLGLVVFTHGHPDHAGSGAALARARGPKLVIGAGDAWMAHDGRHDPLHPTSALAGLLKWFIPDTIPRFEPDFVVDRELDLEPWAVSGKVRPLAGHTAGSVIVELDDHQAFVGDLMLGGDPPAEHYFHADLGAVHRDIAALLARGVTRFYVGHGEPVERTAVLKAFGSL
jgi:glyoxylase-like metal-dependent hydrolase (beta-lactamase superfamily II)